MVAEIVKGGLTQFGGAVRRSCCIGVVYLFYLFIFLSHYLKSIIQT